MTGRPLRPATRRRLGKPLPHQQADRPRAHPTPPELSTTRPCGQQCISGIRPRFQGLSRSAGQITHVLLTRSPLITHPKAGSSFDLHVLSTPPAFVLSQDQTLRECPPGNNNISRNTHKSRTPQTKQTNQKKGDSQHPRCAPPHNHAGDFPLQRNLDPLPHKNKEARRGIINISGVDF